MIKMGRLDVLLLKIALLIMSRFFDCILMEKDEAIADKVVSMTFAKEGSRYMK